MYGIDESLFWSASGAARRSRRVRACTSQHQPIVGEINGI